MRDPWLDAPGQATELRGRRRQWTIRLRLTMLYGALFLVSGALLLAATYVLVANNLPLVDVERPAPPGRGQGLPLDGLPTPEPPSIDTEVLDHLARQRAQDMRQFLIASGVALTVMTVASVGLGWLVAGRALRPLRTMTTTAQAISARNLHQRLDVRGPDDEIKELADTIDGLLSRLDTAFAAQRLFVANASHELRTPLTLERSLMEVALADSGATVADLRATCERVLISNHHQERLVEALLALARSQQGLDRGHDLDLAEVAATVLDQTRLSLRDLDLEVALKPSPTWGDQPMIERLTANLVDNAVRHNIVGGRVSVRTGERSGQPTLRVTNSGPVIQPDDMAALFEPFRRLGPARAAETEGVGLGLSIVAAVAAVHHAEIEAQPLPNGGLDVWVIFRPTRPRP